jgi:hypothetical protein
MGKGEGRLFLTLSELHEENPESLDHLKQAAENALWMRGNLRHLTRPHGQRWLYDKAVSHLKEFDRVEPLIWLCHRRMGKSFLLLLLCFERAIRQPGAQIKYACATRSQVRQIADPMIGQILSRMPGKIRYRRDQYTLYFRLPQWSSHIESRVEFIGLDYKQGDRLRGPACDLCAIDEARDIAVLKYVVKEVLAAQFIGRKHPLLIMASTPPESMEHPLVAHYIERGFAKDTVMTIPGSKNPDFSEADKEVVREELGGEKSLAYRREIECELISDTSKLVIPEFSKDGCEPYTVVEGPIGRPEYYIPYISLDTGWIDHAGILFAFLDFERQKLCFIGEIFEQYLTLGNLSERVHDMFDDLFSEKCRGKSRWVADCDHQQLETLRQEHNCPFMPADRHDRDASVAAWRTSLVEGRVEIEAMSCPQMVRQHRYGVYNKNRTGFARSETMGHLDLIASAVYMHKATMWTEMPLPIGKAQRLDGKWVSPYSQAKGGMRATQTTKSTLENLLGSRYRRW